MRSRDGGATWEDRKPGSYHDSHALATHPAGPGPGLRGGGRRRGALRRSRAIPGRRWTAGMDRHYVWGLAIDPADPDLWYVSAIIDLAKAQQGVLMPASTRLEIVLVVGEVGGAQDRPGPDRRSRERFEVVAGQQRLQPVPAFGRPALDDPEPRQRAGQAAAPPQAKPELASPTPRGDWPSRVAAPLARPAPVPGDARPSPMSASDRRCAAWQSRAAGASSLASRQVRGEGADGLQHAEAKAAVVSLLTHDQAGVDQGREMSKTQGGTSASTPGSTPAPRRPRRPRA